MEATGVAVVTGGASGIGRALSTELARDGWDVAVLDVRQEPKDGGRPTVELVREAGSDAVHIEADVTDPVSFRSGFEEAAAALGQVTCLVNNAGGSRTSGRLEETGPDQWREEIAFNLDTVYHGCRIAVPRFREQGEGIIVNISSAAGLQGLAGHAGYSAAKAGVIGMTRSLAAELADVDVDAMVACPGATATAVNDHQGRPVGEVAAEIHKLVQEPVNGCVLRID